MLHWTVHLKYGTFQKNQYLAAVAVKHKLYCFGGWPNTTENNDLIEVHIFNTVSLRWMKLPPVTPGGGERHLDVPYMLWYHTAVLIEHTVYIWGGYDCDFKNCNVLYVFDVDTHRWFKPEVSGSVPEPRSGHSACVLGKVMYIYGGYLKTGRRTNDIYKLDTSTMVWIFINTRGTPPPASFYLSSTIIGTKMFVSGGLEGQNKLISDFSPLVLVSVFDTETNVWLNTSPAPLSARHGHSAFAYNGELYIIGKNYTKYMYLVVNCYRLTKDCKDLWKCIPETFSWKKVVLKRKRLLFHVSNKLFPVSNMCCCMMEDLLILFGHDNLYILDLSPSLKTLCKLAVIKHGLERSELPHNIKWELAAMPTNRWRRQ